MNCWILPWSFRVTSPLSLPARCKEASLVGDWEEETSELAFYPLEASFKLKRSFLKS